MVIAAWDTHVTCFTMASEYTYFALRLQDAFLVTIWLGKPQDNGRGEEDVGRENIPKPHCPAV